MVSSTIILSKFDLKVIQKLKQNLLNSSLTDPIIRKAMSDDEAQIWSILKPIIRNGETFAIKKNTKRNTAIKNWMYGKHSCYIIKNNTRVMGSYYICTNQEGGGDHICNCGFIVRSGVAGNGYGRLMVNHSINLAKKMGFKGMQFNFVVSNNKNAINLWKSVGFEIVGRLPLAFHHPTDGLIDALVMFNNFSKE